VRFVLSKRMAHAALNPASPAIPFAASGPGAAVLYCDAALMARVQAGDLDAFEPLVRRYERRLFGYFLNLVEDPAAEPDIRVHERGRTGAELRGPGIGTCFAFGGLGLGGAGGLVRSLVRFLLRKLRLTRE